MQANIFSIVRSSMHDGYGLRTVVYFKGCNLHCAWCHNPEGLSVRGEVLYYREKCIGCRTCVNVCPNRCYSVSGDALHIDRERCENCRVCVENCPAMALQSDFRKIGEEELLSEILKDREYYRRTGGGVTFTGGECLLQPDFLKHILAKCRASGIHTIVESALYIGWETIGPLLPLTDCFMTDLKCMDPATHKRMTGAGNERILKNIQQLSREHGDVWVRIPLIPGVNDSAENLEKSAEFLNGCGGGIRRLEILRYNDLAKSKYEAMGKPMPFSAQPQTPQRMQEVKEFVRRRLKKEIDLL